MNKPAIPGVIVVAERDLGQTIETLNRETEAWTMRAARGECAWICADCCVTFPAGMPDACEHGHQSCTEIIKRDKAAAAWPQYRDMTDAQLLEWGAAESAARQMDLLQPGREGLLRAQQNAEQRRKAIGATKNQAADLVLRANRETRRSAS